MSDVTKDNVDSHTGTPTTGHEWDGIKELNTPLPRWWLWVFYATIVWAAGYWLVYPAWPLIWSSTQGVIGWHSRAAVEEELADLRALRGPMTAKIAAASLEEVERTPELLSFARAQGSAAFATNCAQCHGAGAQGAKGYPNLNDDDWLWGGKLADIQQTITHGVRWSTDDKTRTSSMPAFGRDGILKAPDVSIVADYVRSLSGLSTPTDADLAKGKQIFADNCAACHGAEGKGNRDMGAPNLTDQIWLYGSDKVTIVNRINNGGGGVMPAWSERLDEATIKSLAVYVHTLGGGQ